MAVLVAAVCYLALCDRIFHRLSPRSRFLTVAPLFIGIVVATFLFA
jgi:hypothetical protein